MEKKDYPILLTVSEVSKILGVSRRVAYEIMDAPKFPLIKIRRSKRVNRDDFFAWLEENKKIS